VALRGESICGGFEAKFERRGLTAKAGRMKAPFKPMALHNMRENGVRAVIATCQACGHKADVNVDA
jgi:hypothetical protein